MEYDAAIDSLRHEKTNHTISFDLHFSYLHAFKPNNTTNPANTATTATMPSKKSSKKKGGKNSRRGAKARSAQENRDLPYAGEGQEYAQTVRRLGGNHLEVQCYRPGGSASKVRLAVIRGNMMKRQFIRDGDFLLVSIREYQDAKCDVVLKYTDEEARKLRAFNELPNEARIGEFNATSHDDAKNGPAQEDIGFDFENI